jgi:hypothetical protein
VLGPDARLPDGCVKTDLPAQGDTADIFGARLVRVTKLEDERVWVRGVHKAYLARLPGLPR